MTDEAAVKFVSAAILVASLTLLGCAGAPPAASSTLPAPSGRIPRNSGVPHDGASAALEPLPQAIWGLALDADGNLYIADGATSVYKINSDCILTRFAGLPS